MIVQQFKEELPVVKSSVYGNDVRASQGVDAEIDTALACDVPQSA